MTTPDSISLPPFRKRVVEMSLIQTTELLSCTDNLSFKPSCTPGPVLGTHPVYRTRMEAVVQLCSCLWIFSTGALEILELLLVVREQKPALTAVATGQYCRWREGAILGGGVEALNTYVYVPK
eukprot:732462-Amorphochlora_amoeboformis.AAC.1